MMLVVWVLKKTASVVDVPEASAVAGWLILVTLKNQRIDAMSEENKQIKQDICY